MLVGTLKKMKKMNENEIKTKITSAFREIGFSDEAIADQIERLAKVVEVAVAEEAMRATTDYLRSISQNLNEEQKQKLFSVLGEVKG